MIVGRFACSDSTMRELVIQPLKEGKGRSFQATLLAYVIADSLWAGGSANTEAIRPVWMMVGGTENELRPFIANLQLGRKAEAFGKSKNPDRFEILKSAGFQTTWQRTEVGSAVTLFAPDLFRVDPGMVDPKGVEFCILPDKLLVKGIHVEPEARRYVDTLGVPENYRDHILRMCPLFIGYLDRRTRCPLVRDQRFYAQVLTSALTQGLATWSADRSHYYGRDEWGKHGSLRFVENDTDDVGLAPGIAFRSSHERLEQFLAEQVRLYFGSVNHG